MNHLQRKTGPILSESFSSDVLHSILGSPTDTVVQALNEAFDDAKVANISQSAKICSNYLCKLSRRTDRNRKYLGNNIHVGTKINVEI